VWRADKLFYRRAIGVRNTATSRRKTSNLRVRIGSVTRRVGPADEMRAHSRTEPKGTASP
jgi:hypothetical protein